MDSRFRSSGGVGMVGALLVIAAAAIPGCNLVTAETLDLRATPNAPVAEGTVLVSRRGPTFIVKVDGRAVPGGTPEVIVAPGGAHAGSVLQ